MNRQNRDAHALGMHSRKNARSSVTFRQNERQSLKGKTAVERYPRAILSRQHLEEGILLTERLECLGPTVGHFLNDDDVRLMPFDAPKKRLVRAIPPINIDQRQSQALTTDSKICSGFFSPVPWSDGR